MSMYRLLRFRQVKKLDETRYRKNIEKNTHTTKKTNTYTKLKQDIKRNLDPIVAK